MDALRDVVATASAERQNSLALPFASVMAVCGLNLRCVYAFRIILVQHLGL